MSDWYAELQGRVDGDRDWVATRYNYLESLREIIEPSLIQLLAQAKAKLEKEPILDDPAHFSLPPYDWRE